MIGARAALLGLLLAVGVTVAYRGIVNLVNASGARDQPALILILLLSAFLGVLVGGGHATLRLPGATAPTALVLGWTLIPVVFAAIPSAATELFGGPGPEHRTGSGPRDRDGRGRRDAGGARRASLMDADRDLIDEQIAYYRARARGVRRDLACRRRTRCRKRDGHPGGAARVRATRPRDRARRRHRPVDRHPRRLR